MFRGSYRIATVFGIPIKLHISLILMVLFLVKDFGLVKGILLEVGLATSIVLHELGHSLVAIRKGCRVREITLMCIGGAAQMEKMPSRPLDEFLMAIAGPLVSLALGLTCFFGGAYLPLKPLIQPLNMIQFLGAINLGLVIFNLLPSFPMDGGRVLRAALTPRMGRLRATLAASRLGQIMAVAFGIYGFMKPHWFLVAIAFFIYIAAGNEYRLVQLQEAARRGGHGPSMFGQPWDEDNPEDKVRIGPPPYEKGPGTTTDIKASDDDPFQNLFRP